MGILSLAKKITGQEKSESKQIKKQSEEKNVASEVTQEQSANQQKFKIEALITEKSLSGQAGDQNTVAFKVHPKANKKEIAEAVEAEHGVKPVAVRTLLVRGKRRRRRDSEGMTQAWKKAYVTLPKGKQIDFS